MLHRGVYKRRLAEMTLPLAVLVRKDMSFPGFGALYAAAAGGLEAFGGSTA